MRLRVILSQIQGEEKMKTFVILDENKNPIDMVEGNESLVKERVTRSVDGTIYKKVTDPNEVKELRIQQYTGLVQRLNMAYQ